MIRLTLIALTLTGLAACGGDAPTPASSEHQAKATYACPMHPDITADSAIKCSKCGMKLVKQEAHDHSSHEHGSKAH